MFGIDDATAVAVMPTPEAAGTPGFFTEGNPGLGQAATYVRASFLNAFQTELLNILTAAGITPSKTVYDQLLTGLRSNALITGNATGAANTYAVAYTPAIATLVDGMVLWFKASATNTGASTLNINAVGAKAIVGGAHSALQGGEIVANGRCMVVWNTALNSFVLIECTGAALQVGTGTQSQHAATVGQAGFQNCNVYRRIGGVQQVAVNGAAFTSVGASTFTHPTSGRYFRQVWGAAGGSGGTFGANSASQGGAGGGYAEELVTGTTPGATATVTVGAGGTFGTPNGGAPTAGASGGTSSVGTGSVATGGGGGTGALNGIAGGTPAPGSGTNSSGAGLTASGSSPNTPFAISAGTVSATGGGSPFGAPPKHSGAQSVSAAGGDGIFPGGGASGSLNQANGGTGADGLVKILY